jgi:hypothetical protein
MRMSITVEYFFNSTLKLQELAVTLRTWMGCSLEPYEGNPDDLYCRLLGMELSLGRHELINDGELNFKDFAYRLDIRTPWPDADFRPLQVIVMTGLAYAMHRRMQIAGMLVFDCQRLLARFERRPEADGSFILYDLTANERVVFPGYLTSLFARVPAGSLDGSMEQSMADFLSSIGRDVRKPET